MFLTTFPQLCCIKLTFLFDHVLIITTFKKSIDEISKKVNTIFPNKIKLSTEKNWIQTRKKIRLWLLYECNTYLVVRLFWISIQEGNIFSKKSCGQVYSKRQFSFTATKTCKNDKVLYCIHWSVIFSRKTLSFLIFEHKNMNSRQNTVFAIL